MLKSPRSLDEQFTRLVMFRKLVPNVDPFKMIFIVPHRSTIKIRFVPSPALTMSTGLLNPDWKESTLICGQAEGKGVDVIVGVTLGSWMPIPMAVLEGVTVTDNGVGE